MTSDSTTLIEDLIALYGPSGQEAPVREYLDARLRAVGCIPEVDAKGNLIVTFEGSAGGPDVLVTAHLDEIALLVTGIDADGKVHVAPVGGAYTFKWGEGPMDILTSGGPVPAILSFGSIHTNNKQSVIEHARHAPYPWDDAYLFTGLGVEALAESGVRPGLRVVLGAARRVVTHLGEWIGSYFLDDRADLAVWFMAIESLAHAGHSNIGRVTFAATSSEEVGGEGARYLLQRRPADICVALEIGPRTPDCYFEIDSQPTIWVRDGYAAMETVDNFLLEERCRAIGITPHWQYLSRGGSDATCCAALGLTARPVTFGLPVENSHGYEIMHRDAPGEMLRLLLDYLQHLR